MNNKLSEIIEEALNQRKTTQELVAEVLRKAILHGHFKGGAPINTSEIEKKLGISRMPVRIALQQLEKEGLVELQPHKRPIAVKLSAEEVGKIFLIRCELESLAIKLAFPNITEEGIAELETLILQMEQEKDPKKFIDLNMMFHKGIYKFSDNDILNNLIDQFRNNVERYLRIYLTKPTHFENANREHREILDSIKNGDMAHAELATREHLNNNCKMIIRFLE